MKLNSSTWLITFSDLFFILVSFFILRHQLIINPDKLNEKDSSDNVKNIQEREDTEIKNSYFKLLKIQNKELLNIPITKGWFIDNQLSVKGKEELKTLGLMLENYNISLEVAIFNKNEKYHGNTKKILKPLLVELNHLGIDTLKLKLISNLDYKIESDEIGSIYMIFDSI